MDDKEFWDHAFLAFYREPFSGSQACRAHKAADLADDACFRRAEQIKLRQDPGWTTYSPHAKHWEDIAHSARVPAPSDQDRKG